VTAPPVAQLGAVSLAAVIIGGIVLTSGFPGEPSLTAPWLLLAISALLLAACVVLMLRHRSFAWTTFIRIARWALLAYVIVAGMIEYAFVRNHVSGTPLLVASLMLLVFALDVPLLIGFTAARYERSGA